MLGLLLQQCPEQLVVKFGLFVLTEKEKQKAIQQMHVIFTLQRGSVFLVNYITYSFLILIIT